MALLHDPTLSHSTVPACDRVTDRYTDGQTHDDRIYRASIASRDNNRLVQCDMYNLYRWQKISYRDTE